MKPAKPQINIFWIPLIVNLGQTIKFGWAYHHIWSNSNKTTKNCLQHISTLYNQNNVTFALHMSLSTIALSAIVTLLCLAFTACWPLQSSRQCQGCPVLEFCHENGLVTLNTSHKKRPHKSGLSSSFFSSIPGESGFPAFLSGIIWWISFSGQLFRPPEKPSAIRFRLMRFSAPPNRCVATVKLKPTNFGSVKR